jgi:hypothetical protein
VKPKSSLSCVSVEAYLPWPSHGISPNELVLMGYVISSNPSGVLPTRLPTLTMNVLLIAGPGSVSTN